METEFVCSAQSNENVNSLDTNGCTYGECLPQNATEYDPLQYPCSSTSDCMDISLTNNAYYCCAYYICSDSSSTPTYCVNSASSGLEQPNQFTDPACVAECVSPLDAICVAVPLEESDETSECAIYGDDYCCMVQISQGENTYNDGQAGRCNSIESVDNMQQSDQYEYICSALLGLSFGLLSALPLA
mmetsp:Transcript_31111/g.30568  ORF Transcript_31111/g.30568 Transcript_31111/m.30568 type:complete len:187 (+) Transcript_31111:313-873(+)